MAKPNWNYANRQNLTDLQAEAEEAMSPSRIDFNQALLSTTLDKIERKAFFTWLDIHRSTSYVMDGVVCDMETYNSNDLRVKAFIRRWTPQELVDKFHGEPVSRQKTDRPIRLLKNNGGDSIEQLHTEGYIPNWIWERFCEEGICPEV